MSSIFLFLFFFLQRLWFSQAFSGARARTHMHTNASRVTLHVQTHVGPQVIRGDERLVLLFRLMR